MADVNTRGPRSTGGSTLILAVLLIVVLLLVGWLVMRGGGEDTDVEINAPEVNVEAPATPNVEVKSSTP